MRKSNVMRRRNIIERKLRTKENEGERKRLSFEGRKVLSVGDGQSLVFFQSH